MIYDICYDIYFIMMLLSQDSECAVMRHTDIYICQNFAQSL